MGAVQMSDAIFCLVCHHKNAADAQVCSFCGAPIAQVRPGERTTQKMVSVPATTGSLDSPGRRYLPKLPDKPKLPDNSFALFVLDSPEPLIIENSEAVYLGRFAQVPTASSVDLTQYGAAELGVSRSHARITWSEGIYELEDLASTNGTWLNYQRLAYGKSYELHNGDIILLGQLQLTICLPESTRKWEVNFDVKRTKTVDTVYLQILTPYFLETVLGKFLQAIVDLQQGCLLCRGQNIEDVHILSIQAAHQSPILHISLDNANEAVHYIRKWLNPLRQVYAGLSSPETEVEGPIFQKEFLQTVDSLLLDVNPALDEDAQKEFARQLKPAVTSLVSSELEIVSL
jgi:hypothetical protein